VGIVQPGNDRLASEINELGFLCGKAHDLRFIPGRDELAIPYCDGFNNPEVFIHGKDFAVVKDQLGIQASIRRTNKKGEEQTEENLHKENLFCHRFYLLSFTAVAIPCTWFT
jgi:hypothetical protein